MDSTSTVGPYSPELTATPLDARFSGLSGSPSAASGIGDDKFGSPDALGTTARSKLSVENSSCFDDASPGSVVMHLAAWERELDEVQRQEGELMQGQWKLMREQMSTLMQGLAGMRGQHAELRRSFRSQASAVTMVQSDLRDAESRLSAALAQEREMRLDIWPELDKVLEPIRQELRDEVAARQVAGSAGGAEYARKAEVDALRQLVGKLQASVDQEADERRRGYNQHVDHLRTHRERVEDMDSRHKVGLRNVRDTLDRKMEETAGHFQDLQGQIEALALDLAGPYSDEIEAVRARCRDLGEDLAARLGDVQAQLDKLGGDRANAKMGLDHQLADMEHRLDAEGHGRQLLAEALEGSLESSRENLRRMVQEESDATRRAIEALECEWHQRLEQDGLSREDQSSTAQEILKAKHLTVDREISGLHRRMAELESHTNFLGRLKDRDRDTRLEDLAKELRDLKQAVSKEGGRLPGVEPPGSARRSQQEMLPAASGDGAEGLYAPRGSARSFEPGAFASTSVQAGTTAATAAAAAAEDAAAVQQEAPEKEVACMPSPSPSDGSSGGETPSNADAQRSSLPRPGAADEVDHSKEVACLPDFLCGSPAKECGRSSYGGSDDSPPCGALKMHLRRSTGGESDFVPLQTQLPGTIAEDPCLDVYVPESNSDMIHFEQQMPLQSPQLPSEPVAAPALPSEPIASLPLPGEPVASPLLLSEPVAVSPVPSEPVAIIAGALDMQEPWDLTAASQPAPSPPTVLLTSPPPPGSLARGRAPERGGQPYVAHADAAEEHHMRGQLLSPNRPSRSPEEHWTTDPLREGGRNSEDGGHGGRDVAAVPRGSLGHLDGRRGQFGRGAGEVSRDFQGEPAENLGATFDPNRSAHEVSSPSEGGGGRQHRRRHLAVQGRGGIFPAFGGEFPDDSSMSSYTASPVDRRASAPRPMQVPALLLPTWPSTNGLQSRSRSASVRSASQVSRADEYWMGSPPPNPEPMVMFGHSGSRNANGVYKPLARTYMDAPVYFCREANTYLFRSKNGTWGIGDRPSGSLIAHVPSNTASPNHITGTWRTTEEAGAPWETDPRVRLVPRKAFQTKLKDSMVVVRSHFLDVAGWYLRSRTILNGAPIFFSGEANKTMWYSGSDWIISEVPQEEPCLANSIKTTSMQPESVPWFDAEVSAPDVAEDAVDGKESETTDRDLADEPPEGTDDEQSSIVELSNGFVDESFWPDLSSLGAQPPELQVSGNSSRVFWVRALELRLTARPTWAPPAKWETWDLRPGPVARGAHGNCHVLAAVAALAEFDGFLCRTIFKDCGISPTGCYTLSLHDLAGRATDVTVDDYIPCRPKNIYEKTPRPMYSQPDGNELQILLSEKALAKRAGSYLALASDCAVDGPAPVWKAMTGSRQLRWCSSGLPRRWLCEVVDEECETMDAAAVRREFFHKRLERPRFRANQAVCVYVRSYSTWVRDGIVAQVLKRSREINGRCMPAGTVKVLYSDQNSEKWIPPKNFDLEVKEADFVHGDEVSVYCRSMELWTTGEVLERLAEHERDAEGELVPKGSVHVSYLDGGSEKWISPERLPDELQARRPFCEEAVASQKQEEQEELMEAEEDADLDDGPFAMFRHFERCLELNFVVGASAPIRGGEPRRSDGLISEFVYPVVGCIDVDGARLMVLRNMWGAAHLWAGAWSSGSPEWQEHRGVWEELQRQFAGVEANSWGTGPSSRSSIFAMAWEDFIDIFENVYVSPKDMGCTRVLLKREADDMELWTSMRRPAGA